MAKTAEAPTPTQEGISRRLNQVLFDLGLTETPDEKWAYPLGDGIAIGLDIKRADKLVRKLEDIEREKRAVYPRIR